MLFGFSKKRLTTSYSKTLFFVVSFYYTCIQLCTSSGFSTEALPLLREALTAGLVSSLPNLDNDDYQARNMGIQGIHGTHLLTFSHWIRRGTLKLLSQFLFCRYWFTTLASTWHQDYSLCLLLSPGMKWHRKISEISSENCTILADIACCISTSSDLTFAIGLNEVDPAAVDSAGRPQPLGCKQDWWQVHFDECILRLRIYIKTMNSVICIDTYQPTQRNLFGYDIRLGDSADCGHLSNAHQSIA